MTQTLNIANHNGCNFSPTEETELPAFDRNGEYCGQVYKVSAWAVPSGIHAEMGLPDHIDLCLTNAGHWAPTFEIAEHYLAHTEPPTEFRVKGASLNLFANWPADDINTYSDYRFTQGLSGCWEIEELQGFAVPARETKRAAVFSKHEVFVKIF
jgi:hypothetical protein